jgi:hypothetical protein
MAMSFLARRIEAPHAASNQLDPPIHSDFPDL